MRISLAWNNTFQNKKRTLAAVAGITFANLLIFMQLGLLDFARTNTGTVYNFFDFDLIVTSSRFETLANHDFFDQARLLQARVVPGVDDVAQLDVNRVFWFDTANNNYTVSCWLLGFDLNPRFVPAKDAASLKPIANRGSVMLDVHSHSGFGERRIGKEARIESQTIRIGSLFKMGSSLLAAGACIVSPETYQNITLQDPRQIAFGLIKAAKGTSVLELKKNLQNSLPPDVFIFSKSELIKRETDYYIDVKPIGIMFRAGAFVAFSVGAVILYQVLSTEISNRLRELATLKAVGFRNTYVYGVGIQQALLFSSFSILPALVLGSLLFKIVAALSNLPIHTTLDLCATVFGLSIVMTTISSILALQKVRRADPADLF